MGLHHQTIGGHADVDQAIGEELRRGDEPIDAPVEDPPDRSDTSAAWTAESTRESR